MGIRPVGLGAFTALSRRELVSAPNAQFAVRSAEATFALTSGTTLGDAFDNGSTIDFAGDRLNLDDTGNGTGLSFGIGEDGFNSRRVFGDGPFYSLYFAEDVSTGGVLLVDNGLGFDFGFLVDGNSSGTNNTDVYIDGEFSSFFSTGESGSASVQLPIDAIQDSEILDEPGLAAVADNATAVTLANTAQVVTSATTMVPAPGFVIAMANVEVALDHRTGTDTVMSQVSGETWWTLPPSASTSRPVGC